MSGKNGAIKLVAGNSNPVLAQEIANWLHLPLTKASVRRFADNEIFVEVLENVRGSDVYIIQSTSFPANDHAFKKGHRIMVQVQSSCFPVIDRNPQRFVPNIFLAKESDFQRATQRVYRSGRYASYLAVPVVEPARP